MTLGEKIKQAREQKNISQEELAEQLGVSRQAVSKWENGNSMPHGANKELLGKVLELDLEQDSVAPSKKHRLILFGGWILAAILLVTAVVLCVQQDHEAVEVQPEERSFKSIRFYDSEMNEVLSEALWYDAAKIECILVQWTGGNAGNIKMFSTPTGTQTLEETQLLLTKGILDGEPVALLSAQALKDIFQSHVFFALDFGDGTIVSEIYNVFDHSSLEE